MRLYDRQNAPTAASLLTILPVEFATKLFGYSNQTRPSSHRVFLKFSCTPPHATSLQGHRYLRASKVLHSGTWGAGVDGIRSPRQGHFK
jgi:hypothetical protein